MKILIVLPKIKIATKVDTEFDLPISSIDEYAVPSLKENEERISSRQKSNTAVSLNELSDDFGQNRNNLVSASSLSSIKKDKASSEGYLLNSNAKKFRANSRKFSKQQSCTLGGSENCVNVSTLNSDTAFNFNSLKNCEGSSVEKISTTPSNLSLTRNTKKKWSSESAFEKQLLKIDGENTRESLYKHNDACKRV